MRGSRLAPAAFLIVSLLAAPLAVEAQQSRVYRAGILPVEQMDRLHFMVNPKTAKALGLTIPQSVLFRADEVIE
jgi:hypothetical protein